LVLVVALCAICHGLPHHHKVKRPVPRTADYDPELSNRGVYWK